MLREKLLEAIYTLNIKPIDCPCQMIYDQLVPVKSICRATDFLIEIEGVEADDVIATISKMAKKSKI